MIMRTLSLVFFLSLSCTAAAIAIQEGFSIMYHNKARFPLKATGYKDGASEIYTAYLPGGDIIYVRAYLSGSLTGDMEGYFIKCSSYEELKPHEIHDFYARLKGLFDEGRAKAMKADGQLREIILASGA